jgi:hypothetical protein
VASSTSELGRGNVRGRLGGDASAGRLDGVGHGTVLRGRRWVWHGGVGSSGHNGDGCHVDNRNRGGAGRRLLLLGHVVGGSVDGLVGTVDGGVGRLVSAVHGSVGGLVGTVDWGLSGLSNRSWHAGNVGGRGGGLGDGVGHNSGAAVVANVDRGDGVFSALGADGLDDGLGLGGDTSLARINIGSCDNLDGV